MRRTELLGLCAQAGDYQLWLAGHDVSVQCGPLTAADQASLERASATGTAVRLVFSDSEILLSSVEIEKADRGWFWIEGPMAEGQN